MQRQTGVLVNQPDEQGGARGCYAKTLSKKELEIKGCRRPKKAGQNGDKMFGRCYIIVSAGRRRCDLLFRRTKWLQRMTAPEWTNKWMVVDSLGGTRPRSQGRWPRIEGGPGSKQGIEARTAVGHALTDWSCQTRNGAVALVAFGVV